MACVALASCNKESSSPYEGEAHVYVTVRSGGSDTRVTDASDDNEGKVNDLQVYLFDDSGNLADGGYSHMTNTSTAMLTCAAGHYTVWALVNCKEAEFATLAELKAASVALADQSGSSLSMGGSKAVDLAGSTGVTVDVYRYAARVVIKKITKAFGIEANQAKEFKIKSIFLENVQGANNMELSGFQGGSGTWYNKMKYEASNSLPFLYDAVDVTVSGSYSQTHTFYGFPNDVEVSADHNAGNWSPRLTRLVIEATLDGQTMYYPISMNLGFERNKSYEIEELIITKTGSNDPDTPVTSVDIPFSITVNDWETVLLHGDGVITI